jgi:hypothetical protein
VHDGIKSLFSEDEFAARDVELEKGVDLEQRFMRQIMKTLLYVNSNNARLEEMNSLDQIRERLGNVQPKKRAKLERKMMKESNYIRVGAGIIPLEANPSNVRGGNVKTHWRRGHFRLQHFGKGRAEEKIIWIEPVLVNEEKLTEPGDVKQKEYNVS